MLHDFLKRVADPAVVDAVIAGNRFYDALAKPFFLPLEFTVTGFRFGHTMSGDGRLSGGTGRLAPCGSP